MRTNDVEIKVESEVMERFIDSYQIMRAQLKEAQRQPASNPPNENVSHGSSHIKPKRIMKEQGIQSSKSQHIPKDKKEFSFSDLFEFNHASERDEAQRAENEGHPSLYF